VSHDAYEGGYVSECRELPGLLERAQTAGAAVEKGRDAIISLLTFKRRRRQQTVRPSENGNLKGRRRARG
jgi:predicted RNase H-like HicB family nuclease